MLDLTTLVNLRIYQESLSKVIALGGKQEIHSPLI